MLAAIKRLARSNAVPAAELARSELREFGWIVSKNPRIGLSPENSSVVQVGWFA
jgi:hypothetical protein